MITVNSDRCTDRFIFTVEGHAEHGARGHDVVCAAASVLAFTLYRAVKLLDEEGEISVFNHSISKGNAEFDFTVKEDALGKAVSVVDSIVEGYLLLEENFPECVQVL